MDRETAQELKLATDAMMNAVADVRAGLNEVRALGGAQPEALSAAFERMATLSYASAKLAILVDRQFAEVT